jgi:hypothetical protein
VRREEATERVATDPEEEAAEVASEEASEEASEAAEEAEEEEVASRAKTDLDLTLLAP